MISIGDSVTLKDKCITKYLVVCVGERVKIQSPLTKKYKWVKLEEIGEVFPLEPDLEDVVKEEGETRLGGEFLCEKFKVGDRVLVPFLGEKLPGNIVDWDEDLQSWKVNVEGKDDRIWYEERDLCSRTVNCSEESAASVALSGNGFQKSEQLDTVTLMKMRSQSTQIISQVSPSTGTLEPSARNSGTTTCLLSPSLVQEPVMRGSGKGLSTQTPLSGERDLESCVKSSPSMQSGSSPWELSAGAYESCLEESEWQDIALKLRESRQWNLALDMSAQGYSLFPTLNSSDGKNSRPAGQTKLEAWFKDSDLLASGQQLSAQAMSLVQGFPYNWCDAVSPPKLLSLELSPGLQEDLKQEYFSAERLPRPRQQSHSGVSYTLKVSEKSGGKAISLHQPWASLISTGRKKYETRSWKTKYRGKFLICAARLQPSKVSLQKFGLSEEDCPLGVAIAICDLVDCVPITQELIGQQSEDELRAGEWTVGRYAWKLENIAPVKPVSVRGRQGFWNVDFKDFEDAIIPKPEQSPRRSRGRAQKKASGSLSKLCKQVKDRTYYSFQYNYDVRDPGTKRGWRTVKVGVPKFRSHIIADAIRENRGIREVLSLLGRVPSGEIRE